MKLTERFENCGYGASDYHYNKIIEAIDDVEKTKFDYIIFYPSNSSTNVRSIFEVNESVDTACILSGIKCVTTFGSTERDHPQFEDAKKYPLYVNYRIEK